MHTSDKNKILNISRHEYEDLIKLDNVNGVGLGYKHVKFKNTGELALHVLVNKKVDKSILSSKHLIPKNYMNMQTDVLEIGTVSPQSLTSKIRPLFGGYGISPIDCNSTGTLGCIVYKKTNQGIEYFGLSSSHIFANENLITLGTPVIQPSFTDSGKISTDTIGVLSQFVEIKFDSTPNIVDCAIFKIKDSSIVSSKIALIGVPTGIANPKLNSIVQKIGRTTELLNGKILTIGATIKISYGNNRNAIFTNQILSQAISSPGDSGSLVLDSAKRVVGLLFAGSNHVTVFNNINAVLSSLNISLLI